MNKAGTTVEGNVPYGFAGRLTADFPSQINVDLTDACNLACIHCPHEDLRKSSHYGPYYLDPALNEKLVHEVRQHGQGKTQYIRYTSNGEPLLHPHGYEMIEYAARHSGVYVTLTTNGTIMNEKRIRQVLDAGVHMIDISIDAFTPDTYARIRVNGNLVVTRANVLRLIELVRLTGAKMRVVVSFVEQPLNQEETGLFETFWNNAGADDVIIRRLHSCSGAKTDVAEERRSHPGYSRRPCLYPWERIVLNARGYLTFCPADWYHGSPIADYRTTTIYETWQGSYYRALRTAHLSNTFTGHKFCGQCPDWVATRWPWEGRSYADMIEDFTKEEKSV